MLKGRAVIVSTGPEITQAWKKDSNSEFLLRELNKLNFNVLCRACCDDDQQELTALIKHFKTQMDLVVITGGLGCTDDDITLESIADSLEKKIVFDQEQWELTKKKLGNRCSDAHKGFAHKIEGSQLFNGLPGVAAGHFLETPECTFIILPGPPDEVHDRFSSILSFFINTIKSSNSLTPFFTRMATGRVPVPVRLRFYNISESGLVSILKLIKVFLNDMNLEFSGTFLGNRRYVEALFLRTTDIDFGFDNSLEHKNAEAQYDKKLCVLIKDTLENFDFSDFQKNHAFFEKPEKIIVTPNVEPWQIVAEKLKTQDKDATIGFAESLTGGAVSSAFVDLPGISQWMLGSIVAYHNSIKASILDVSNEILDTHGAVSAECAKAMAHGASIALKSSITVSCTGIAGPGGGSDLKPVGLVYLTCINSLVSGGDKRPFELTEKRVFRGSREQIRSQTMDLACFMMLQSLS